VATGILLKINVTVRAELRLFAFFLANRTLDAECLSASIDYSSIFNEASSLEQVFAIWANVIEIDEDGVVRNAGNAARRAAQYIRSYVDSSFIVEPPFEEWELALHM
jgi:hypothetical protein